jgi:hypothetical protein
MVNMTVVASPEILNTTIVQLFPFLADKFSFIVKALQVVGVVFVLWLIFSISQLFLKFRDSKRLKRIEEKLDLLLARDSKKRK